MRKIFNLILVLTAVLLIFCVGIYAEDSASGSFGADSDKKSWGNYFAWSYDSHSKTMRIFDGIDTFDTATHWYESAVCNTTGLKMKEWKAKYAPVTEHIEVDSFGKHNDARLFADWTAAKSFHFSKMTNLQVKTNTVGLFSGCTSLTKVWSGSGSGTDNVIDLSTWRVRNSENPGNSFKNLLSGCSSALKVILPSSNSDDSSGVAFTVIDPTTFAGCTSLQSIGFGVTVTTIENGSFSGCPNALFDASNNAYVRAWMAENPGVGAPVTGSQAYGEYSDMEWSLFSGKLTITHKNNNTSFSQIAFTGSTWEAFVDANKNAVKEIYIVIAEGAVSPSKIYGEAKYSFGAFKNCTKVIIPTDFSEYQGHLWQNAVSLTTYGVEGTPEGTIDLSGVSKWTSNTTGAFEGVAATTVILPNKPTPATLTGTLIAPFAESAITNVIVPENVTTIPTELFSGCTITSVTFNGSAKNIASALSSKPFEDSNELKITVFSTEAAEAVRKIYPLAKIIAGGTFSASGLTFDGWQVRSRDYNGLRAIMYFDNSTKNNGFELVEYGAFVTTSANKADAHINEDGSFEGTGAKVTVYKNGEIKANTLPYSTEAKTYFALSVVNYKNNWTTDIYVCAYEIWKDTVADKIKIIYTDYATDKDHDPSFADTNIYEISLGMYKNGIIDASSDPHKVVWETLVNGGAVKLTAGNDYSFDPNANYGADYSKNMFLVNIPLSKVTFTDGELNFENSDTSYSVFKDGNDYFMVISGKGEVPDNSSDCMPQFSNVWYNEMEYESISNDRPQPVFGTNIYTKIKNLFIDYGVTVIGDRAFAFSALEMVVYSETVNDISITAFEGTDGVSLRPSGSDAPVLGDTLSAYGTRNGIITKDKDEKMINDSYKMTRLTSGVFGLEYSIPRLLTKDKTAVLSFKAYTEDSYTTVKVSVTNTSGNPIRSYTYSLSSGACEIFMPMTATGNESKVRFDIGQQPTTVHIGDISINDFEGSLYDAPTGSYMLKSDDWDDIKIPFSSRISDMTACRDIIVRDGYIFAIGNGNLYVYKANGLKPELISKIVKVGDLRQMIMTDDGDGLIITARAAGVFVFDISDPENPIMSSHIDAAEHATGIDSSGDYCYIADRMFGLAIINISNLYNPVVTSYISIGECQDVSFYNGFVYCGVWGSCAIQVVDARDPDAPVHTKTLALSGRGDGISIADGIMYAATGHFYLDQETIGSAGYGLGNGMDIFDLSDPANPKKIAVAQSDGACYYHSPDLWRVTLSGKYAFLSDCFSGLYVYDITNPSLPSRVAHINIEAKKGESGYKNLDSSDSVMLPFDTTAVRNYPIVDCDMADGYLYIASYDSGLYIYETELAKDPSKNENGTAVTAPEYDLSAWVDADELNAMGLSNVSVFKTGTQIWEVIEHDGYLYVAAGTDGIYVLDTDMNILNQIPTHDITMAIDIGDDGRLYTAESTEGICIYEFDPENSTKLNFYKQFKIQGSAFCDLTVAPGSKYILIQRDSASSLIDIRDMNNIKFADGYQEYTMVYQHQITDKAVDNRYLMVAAATGKPSALLDFGENGSYDVPKITYWVSGIEQGRGICSDGERFFGIDSSLYSFDPNINGLTSSKVTSEGNPASINYGLTTGLGVPNICGDYLFVRYRRNGVYSIYKFEDGDHTKKPSLIEKYDMKNKAHPSATVVVGEKAYVALGYAGLASFDLEG